MSEEIKIITPEIFQNGLTGVYEKNKEKISDLKLRSVIGKELSYGEFIAGLATTTASTTQYIIATTNSYGNMTKNDDGTITLKRGTTYKISFTGSFSCANNTYITLSLCDSDGNILRTMSFPRTLTYEYKETECGEHSCFYKATNDINIKINAVSSTANIDNCYSAKIIIEEINRQVIIDPMEDAKNLEFEHGIIYYASENELAKNTTPPTVGNFGNISMNGNNIILKAGKKYRIGAFARYVISKSMLGYALYVGGINLILPIITSNNTVNASASHSEFVEFEPTVDTEIYPYLNDDTTKCYVDIIVEEIVHPCYFNYFKDSIGSKVLFEGTANAKDEYALNDDITNYKWIVIQWETSLTANNLRNLYEDYITVDNIVFGDVTVRHILSSTFSLKDSTNKYSNSIFINFKDHQNFNIIGIESDGSYSVGNGITRIIGYGFIYDNPYKDLITSGESSFSYSEDDINDIYNSLGGN